MLHKYSYISVVKNFFLLLFIASFLFSCKKFDGNQTIAAYIHIEKITLFANTISNDTISSKITDAWVYIDDQSIGAFELPVTFPVLKKGKHKISIYPGIKMNGISGTRIQYDFYKKIDIIDSTLVEGKILKIDTIDSKTFYKDNLIIWNEDFEGGSPGTVNFQKRSSSDTIIVPTNATGKVFEGNYSGMITLDQNQTFFEIETKADANGDNFILPKSSSPVFLEMNYKTNNSVYVGLLVYQPNQTFPSAQVSTIFLKPTTEWKKIYINFTPDINDYYNAGSFKVFIGGFKDAGIHTAEILFDNIKLIHFPVSK